MLSPDAVFNVDQLLQVFLWARGGGDGQGTPKGFIPLGELVWLLPQRKKMPHRSGGFIQFSGSRRTKRDAPQVGRGGFYDQAISCLI